MQCPEPSLRKNEKPVQYSERSFIYIVEIWTSTSLTKNNLSIQHKYKKLAHLLFNEETFLL